MSRPIKYKAWDRKYEIGSDGSVWSLDYNHSGNRNQLKPYKDMDGYLCVVLTHNRKRTIIRIHRAVAILFLEDKPTNKHQVNHKDGVKTNNDVENLEWVTSQQNTIHGWKHNGRKVSEKVRLRGRMQFTGTNNPKAKLTKDDVSIIRNLRQEGMYLKDIAGRFHMSVSQIGAICNGRFWNE